MLTHLYRLGTLCRLTRCLWVRKQAKAIMLYLQRLPFACDKESRGLTSGGSAACPAVVVLPLEAAQTLTKCPTITENHLSRVCSDCLEPHTLP